MLLVKACLQYRRVLQKLPPAWMPCAGGWAARSRDSPPGARGVPASCARVETGPLSFIDNFSVRYFLSQGNPGIKESSCVRSGRQLDL